MEIESLVSIIVPVYNTENYLSQCVDSLRVQTYKHLEIILVNDGSTDRCPAICDSYALQDDRIRVIHKENGGVSSSREIGISAASGDYILFVDSDDWIDPETVLACVESAQASQSGCVMFGYTREYPGKSLNSLLFEKDFSYDEHLSEEKIHRRIVGPMGKELHSPQRMDNFSTVWGKLYRADIARRGHIINERIIGTSEDTVFNLYALDCCRISYINRCYYHYRKNNPASISSAYKPDLAGKWDILYEVFQEYIKYTHRENTYQTAFMNRVACGMIGLGLNELNAHASLFTVAERLKGVLSKPLYQAAFSQFTLSYCSWKWKPFFLLCKKKAAVGLVIMLRVMAFLRSKATRSEGLYGKSVNHHGHL